MIAAFPFLGIFQVFVFIPVIPEIFERLTVELDITEGENTFIDGKLNDKCNDTYGLVYALSMFIAPNLGDFMKTHLGGHENSCDAWFIINITCFLILFIFNGDFRVFKENREFLAKLNKLQNVDEKEGSRMMMMRSRAGTSYYARSHRHYVKD